MKFLLLAFLLSVVVVGHLNASSSSDEDVLGEQLWEALQQAAEDTDDDDDDFERDRRNIKASEKYKNNIQDERLRGCIKCVGNERSKGANVKQATKVCNRICKRSLFDTRSIFDDEE